MPSLPLSVRQLLQVAATAFASFLICDQVSVGQDQAVIPMASYNDLLNRIETLESQVAHTQHSSGTRRKSGAAPSEGGVFASYDLLLLKPVYSNNTAFYTHDTVAGFDEGAILTEFDYDAQASHRVELGYLSPTSNLGWRSRYWFFDADDSKQSRSDVDVKIGIADDPDIAIDTVSATSPDFYLAEARTSMHVLDLEAVSKRTLYKNNVTLASGIRYASVEHAYFGQDILAGAAENILRTQFNFRGLGPTVALQSRRPLDGTCFGWNVGA
ncbi:MAG: hypothetical protein AAGG44_07745, partial [Planctomycetota bacterium]